jgi:serine/threonine-protein phosphatase 4 regulatory subunit 1
LVLVRELYETCVEAGYKESVSRILPVLSNFVSDSEPAVRQIFAEQLDQLAEFFLKVKKTNLKL